jgi:Mor family transcriptional regulator
MIVKMRKPRISLERKMRILTDYNTEGMPIETILKRNHVSVHSLYRIIKEKVSEYEK